ncbi:MAG TPA: hypothetical protein VIC33_01970 [Vicinamibacterales bacterium]|jgi:hypothetical protein
MLTDALSRRQILQMLTAIGITGPAAASLAAQARTTLTVDDIRHAEAILDQPFADDRLPVIERALQRNLNQFQAVRDLKIDDLIEPAPIFLARGR